VVKLAEAFTLNDAIRYQLVLSTVKQLRVLDLLNAMPAAGGRLVPASFGATLLLLLFVLR
jgi:hypothetical protein